MKAYYLLEVGDVMREGDEFYNYYTSDWTVVRFSKGEIVQNSRALVRRPIRHLSPDVITIESEITSTHYRKVTVNEP